MQIQIRERGGNQLRSHETLVEEFAAAHLLDQISRDHLTRTIVHGVVLEQFGLEGPILHHLRGKLDKITLHLRKTAIFHIVEEEVERMAKLMEERLGLIEGQQGRRRSCRAGKVADNGYDRSNALTIAVTLLDIVATPSTLPLAGTRMEVEIEHAEVRIIGIQHLIGRDLGVIDRHRNRTEGDAIEAISQEEDTAAHILQREIGAQHLLVNGIVAFAHLLGIIPPIPRSKALLRVVLGKQLAHLLQLLGGTLKRGGPDLVEQIIDRFGRAGHLIRDHIVGIGVKAQQMGLFGTQTDEVVDQLFVVVFIALVATVQIGRIELFTQIAPRSVGQEGDQARLVERKDIALHAHLLALLGC